MTDTPSRMGDGEVAIRLLAKLANEQALYLDQLADTMDNWAWHSKTGGWSTHQVADNEAKANDCRRRVSQLRIAVSKVVKTPPTGGTNG